MKLSIHVVGFPGSGKSHWIQRVVNGEFKDSDKDVHSCTFNTTKGPVLITFTEQNDPTVESFEDIQEYDCVFIMTDTNDGTVARWPRLRHDSYTIGTKCDLPRKCKYRFDFHLSARTWKNLVAPIESLVTNVFGASLTESDPVAPPIASGH